jgi:YYY domain-containing protein
VTPGALDRTAWAFGVLGGTFVTISGNLVGPLEILAARGVGGAAFWQAVGVRNLEAAANPVGLLPSNAGWWWHASRVIPTIEPDGITEFPYFSFLLGDLHPHFTALPLLLLVASLVLTALREGSGAAGWGEIGFAGLMLGVPLAANTWDAATAWALYGGACLLLALKAGGGERIERRKLLQTLLPIPIGLALFSPYFIGYASQPLGIGIVTDQTPLVSMLIIFGPWLLLAVVGGVAVRQQHPELARLDSRIFGIAGAALIATAIATQNPTLVLTAGLGGLGAALTWGLARRWIGQEHAGAAAALYLAGIVSLALLIVAMAEVLFLRDTFGSRMNTVFKFYYHVWLLLALAAAPAAALALLRTEPGGTATTARLVGRIAVVAVVGLGLVYPLAATWTKSNGFRGTPTLDGAAFLQRARPGDAAAVRWLAQRPNRPVIMEAVGGDYQEFARISTFSGLPTVIGWVGHELQWRGFLEEYVRRQQDIDAVYRRADRDEGMRIMERYDVSYVIFGSLEQERYGRQEDRLASWLRPVFREQGTTVFAVPREGGEL